MSGVRGRSAGGRDVGSSRLTHGSPAECGQRCASRDRELRATRCSLATTLAWCLALAALTACEGNSQHPRTVVLTGSSTVAPLAAEIARRFEAEHPGVRIDVQTGGSSRGIADARTGVADIGMVSRELHEDEHDLHAFPLGRDGIAMIVHRANPVRELTREQIVGIYTGAISSWAELGGADADITVVHKAAGRSTLELFLEHFELNDSDVHPDVIIGDNEQGVRSVAGNPHAVGYVSIGVAEVDVAAGVAIRLLPLDGVPATTVEVGRGRYPLLRTLNLVTRESPTGDAAAFIDFARSEHAAQIIENLSFVPILE